MIPAGVVSSSGAAVSAGVAVTASASAGAIAAITGASDSAIAALHQAAESDTSPHAQRQESGLIKGVSGLSAEQVVPATAAEGRSAGSAETIAPPPAERLDPATVKANIAASLALIGADPDDEETPDASDLAPSELRGALESLLLVATKPLSTERIADLLPGTAPSYLHGFLTGMAQRAEHEQRGWMIKAIAGGWQLVTRERFHPWVRQLDKKELPTKLSRSAMETLAIIAYKQPISRGQIDDIRGVQSGPMVRQLMDMKLVHVIGRSEDLLGKPLIYGTTQAFCDRFGLGSPDDLPKQYELSS